MTVTSKEISDLLEYFSMQNLSNRIISLSLTANNSLAVESKQQTVTFEYPSWDLFDVENSTEPLVLKQFVNNYSSLQLTTNDTFSNHTEAGDKPRISAEIPIWLIPCYSIILIFAVVGNLLVASTLFQNRRMRTITNVFLANLAISDMLLGVLCMPITLVGTYLRHFIFGELVCKFIQFAQAASVAVSSWTLVAISCERYYAICHPLRSRTWQTINHAYKIIGCIWFGSMICMAPIAIFSQLIPTSRQGLRKCREQWPEEAVGYERIYNIFLDLALLVLPLLILCVAYILITRTLYVGIKDEKALIFGSKNNSVTNSGSGNVATGNAKIYTQIEAEIKTPTTFHLNMSFRYHTRKSNANSETMPIVKTSTTDSSKETTFFTNIENTKYSATNRMLPATLSAETSRRGLRCNSLADNEVETEILFQEIKEQRNNLQSHNDDIKLIAACDAGGKTAATTTAKSSKRTTKTIDSRCINSYCLHAAPVKSLSCSSTEATTNKRDAVSTSCFSLNKMHTAHCTRSQRRHHSFNQKQQHLHQNLNNQQHVPLVQIHQQQQQTTGFDEKRKLNSGPSLRTTESALRRSNLEKNLESKKRVVKMLFVLVLEFFICWTPLYVINTVAMFIGPAIYEYVNYTTISFFQLLAYSSSCCNPITYCFMNANFRRAFVDTFKGMHLNDNSFWNKSTKAATNLSVAGNSIALANSCTIMTANSVLESPRL